MSNFPVISICIPTYNRHVFLDRCLRSIELAISFYSFPIEICIYDSSETDDSRKIAIKYSGHLNIKYLHNPNNEGYAGNFKKCLSMAKSKMAWFIGDDDVLVQDSFKTIDEVFSKFPTIDFIYCNAFNLDEEYFKKFQKPFDTKYLPLDMKKFTNVSESKLILFRDLIDHNVSFDFLSGMFLSIFNREMWELNSSCVREETSKLKIKFVDLDSTFPHSKIFANTFMESNAYLSNKPLIVAVSGVREWVEFYPFIRTFRFMDLLMEYKKNGLPYLKYWKNKNFTVKYFAYDALYSFRKRGGRFPNIKLFKYLVSASGCPNFYFSFIRLMFSITRKFFEKYQHFLLGYKDEQNRIM
jgi:glycosyltransferase involved in cell wall biosynthesis